ncbi:MAG: hypothetical protein Fur0037_08920 [Planctomycetota bacterium]
MQKKRRFEWLLYALGRGAVALAALLPERLGYPLAAALGRLYFRCSRRRRRAALSFLGQAFPGMPERERLRLARVATGNVFKVALDVAKLTRLIDRGRDLLEVVDCSGILGRLPDPPFVALTAHLGSWEVAAAAVARLCGEAHGVARVFRNERLQRWMLANRRKAGLHVHPRRGGIRGLARALERGAVGLQAVDQHQRLRGLRVPFFGKEASCERAAASLALRHGYPVLVGFARRQGPGFRFRMVASDPFVPRRTGDRAGDLEVLVREINARLEELIRMAPEQYLWIHERYRDRPEDGQEPAETTSSG